MCLEMSEHMLPLVRLAKERLVTPFDVAFILSLSIPLLSARTCICACIYTCAAYGSATALASYFAFAVRARQVTH